MKFQVTTIVDNYSRIHSIVALSTRIMSSDNGIALYGNTI